MEQLELFKKQQFGSDESKISQKGPNFFEFIKDHEKALLLVIILFISSLISFSLGVERGKRMVKVAKNTQIKEIAQKAPEKEDKIEPEKPKVKKKKSDISQYTVQVATFKTETYAQKEAKKLQRNGLDAIVIPRGKYVIVCVGNFPAKEEATTSLNKLKETYQDCFVRRL